MVAELDKEFQPDLGGIAELCSGKDPLPRTEPCAATTEKKLNPPPKEILFPDEFLRENPSGERVPMFGVKTSFTLHASRFTLHALLSAALFE